MYPAGGMLVQTYPGGPLVAAVPVPMQPVPWNGSTGANGAGPGGEMAFYYALGYPAGDMSGALQLEAGGVNGSRRNSLESYQVRVSLSFFTARCIDPVRVSRDPLTSYIIKIQTRESGFFDDGTSCQHYLGRSANYRPLSTHRRNNLDKKRKESLTCSKYLGRSFML